jgi:anti-sigma B factor antagonist
MQLATEVFGDVVVIHAPEELSEEGADSLFNHLTTQPKFQVVLDLDGTETFDSSGLERLLEIQENLRESNGDLKITTTNKTNEKILEVTRLDAHLEVWNSVIDAVKSFA